MSHQNLHVPARDAYEAANGAARDTFETANGYAAEILDFVTSPFKSLTKDHWTGFGVGMIIGAALVYAYKKSNPESNCDCGMSKA